MLLLLRWSLLGLDWVLLFFVLVLVLGNLGLAFVTLQFLLLPLLLLLLLLAQVFLLLGCLPFHVHAFIVCYRLLGILSLSLDFVLFFVFFLPLLVLFDSIDIVIRQNNSSCNLGIDPLNGLGIPVHFSCRQLASPRNLLHLVIRQTDHHVFRLEVSVDHLAHPVHVVKTDQTLSR